MADSVSTQSARRRTANREIHVTVALPLVALEPNWIVDLVCHTTMPPTSAMHRSRWGEDEFYFCSLFCQRRFDSDPEAFVPRRAHDDESAFRDKDHATA